MDAFSRFADILDYPAGCPTRQTEDFVQEDCRSNAHTCELLEKFAAASRRLGTGRLQEIYTETFDMKAVCSLHAGYHLFGDNWRRNAFLARLQECYRAREFSAGLELPDHICAILRFISGQRDTAEARDLIECCLAPSLAKILGAMDRATNPYAAVIEALLSWIQTDDKRGESE